MYFFDNLTKYLLEFELDNNLFISLLFILNYQFATEELKIRRLKREGKYVEPKKATDLSAVEEKLIEPTRKSGGGPKTKQQKTSNVNKQVMEYRKKQQSLLDEAADTDDIKDALSGFLGKRNARKY